MWWLRCGHFILNWSNLSREGIFLPHPPTFLGTIWEGFRFDHRVPKTGADQHVVGQQGVRVSVLLCVCMCLGANLPWRGSTRISIIKGLWGPPSQLPTVLHLLIQSTLPPLKLCHLSYPSILLSDSRPLNPSLSPFFPDLIRLDSSLSLTSTF